MDLNKYRNCINKLINWEWNTLKKLRRERRRNILLRGFFAIFSLTSILLSVFAPPYILGILLKSVEVSKIKAYYIQIISLFFWLWFISPMVKLSKKKRSNMKR